VSAPDQSDVEVGLPISIDQPGGIYARILFQVGSKVTLRHPAAHRHSKAISLRDEFKDLGACQLKLLLKPVATWDARDDWVDRRGLCCAEPKRRIET
jgi:hypothetical protein